MKKSFLFLTILSLIIAGCKKKSHEPVELLEFVEDISQPISVEWTEGSLVVSFKAYVEWVAKVDDAATSWLTITSTSGDKGDFTLTLNYALNETDAEREGTITVSCADASFTIKVKQKDSDVFSVMDDAEFKEKCKEFDTNNDGKLSLAEAKAVTEGINVEGTYDNVGNIKSLKGIEYFTNLQRLHCDYNQITSLDVSKNTVLEVLACGCNQLTSLELGKNAVLSDLHCYNNQLKSLDVSDCTGLRQLNIHSNQLTSLNVNSCTILEWLYCEKNQLTSLEVGSCAALRVLACDDNQLVSVDVSENTTLEKLYLLPMSTLETLYLKSGKDDLSIYRDRDPVSIDDIKNQGINIEYK